MYVVVVIDKTLFVDHVVIYSVLLSNPPGQTPQGEFWFQTRGKFMKRPETLSITLSFPPPPPVPLFFHIYILHIPSAHI